MYLLLLLLVGRASALFESLDWVPESDFYQPGDVNIGVLGGSSYSHCKYDSRSRIQGLSALRHRLNEVNSNDTILPNIKVGLVWLDNCWELDVSIMRSLKLIPVGNCFKSCCSEPVPGSKDPNERGCYDVIGFIAPWRDDQAIPISRIAGMYHIPHISAGATYDKLSDRKEFPYFMRINPPNSLQIRVIFDAIVHFNWTYVSLIGDYTEYSRDVVAFFRKLLKPQGICIAFYDVITSDFDDDDYDTLARRVAKYPKARVIVVLAETIETGYFVGAYKRLDLNKKFILFAPDRYNFERQGSKLVNSLGIAYSLSDVKRPAITFKDIYKSRSPWAYIDDPHAEKPRDIDALECSVDLPEGNNKSCLTKYKTWEDIPNHTVYGHHQTFVDVFNVFIEGLHTMITKQCPEAFAKKDLLSGCINGTEYLAHLYNVTFIGQSGLIKFDSGGDGIIDYVLQQLQFASDNGTETVDVEIASWAYDSQSLEVHSSKLKWELDNAGTREKMEQPESVCAKPCKVGEFYIQGELKCCWDCRKCRDNEIVRNDSLGCDICPILTWPDQDNFTKCIDIPPTYMVWYDPIAIGIEICSTIGLGTCFILTYLMVRHRKHKVIKGSSVEQMTMILLALYMCYVTTVLLIIRPNYYLCYVEYCTYHLSCSFIFIPLFLKTNRLYRIFKAAERCQQEIKFVSAQALMAFSLMLLLGQVALLCYSMVMYPLGDLLQMPVTTEKFVELVCINSLENLLIPLVYNLLILLMCLIFGFLTRKLPDNFNESWYIFLSVATTLFIWIAFLPTYFMAFYAYHKGALLALALILNAAVTAICLFAPKVYAIYFIPENEIQTSNFDSKSMSSGGTSVTKVK